MVDVVHELRNGSAGWPTELDLVRRWYEPYLERIHDDAVVRQPDLIQLAQIATGFPSRDRFLPSSRLTRPAPPVTKPAVRCLMRIIESKRVDEFANMSDEELRQYLYRNKELDS